MVESVAQAQGLPLDIREDRHFFSSVREFAAHAETRKSLRMEYFYRAQRQRHGVLMQERDPVGGQWNFDAENRGAFGAAGPGAVPARSTFEPDAVTREVIALVESRFAAHPGRLDSFAWPVTRAQALQSLHAFIRDRMPLFGRYQDAIRATRGCTTLTCRPHQRNFNPREVVTAAEVAYHHGSTAASAKAHPPDPGWRGVRSIY
jgi:deoxyribodipyrimidine photolyase-related protein